MGISSVRRAENTEESFEGRPVSDYPAGTDWQVYWTAESRMEMHRFASRHPISRPVSLHDLHPLFRTLNMHLLPPSLSYRIQRKLRSHINYWLSVVEETLNLQDEMDMEKGFRRVRDLTLIPMSQNSSGEGRTQEGDDGVKGRRERMSQASSSAFLPSSSEEDTEKEVDDTVKGRLERMKNDASSSSSAQTSLEGELERRQAFWRECVDLESLREAINAVSVATSREKPENEEARLPSDGRSSSSRSGHVLERHQNPKQTAISSELTDKVSSAEEEDKVGETSQRVEECRAQENVLKRMSSREELKQHSLQSFPRPSGRASESSSSSSSKPGLEVEVNKPVNEVDAEFVSFDEAILLEYTHLALNFPTPFTALTHAESVYSAADSERRQLTKCMKEYMDYRAHVRLQKDQDGGEEGLAERKQAMRLQSLRWADAGRRAMVVFGAVDLIEVMQQGELAL